MLKSATLYKVTEDKIEIASPAIHLAKLNDHFGTILLYTSCEYDPVTGDIVSGKLLSHDEIMRSTNVDDLLHRSNIIYFSVDVDSRHPNRTELQLSGTAMATGLTDTVDEVRKFFHVADTSYSGSADWYDIHSAEFETAYRAAARQANRDLDVAKEAYLDYEGTRGAKYATPFYAICFAVIDKKSEQGVVDTDPYLITAFSPDDYTAKCNSFATTNNIPFKDLVFKTLYTRNTPDTDFDGSRFGMDKQAAKLSRDLRKAIDAENITIRRYYDSVIVREYYSRKRNFEFYIRFSDNALDPIYDEQARVLYVPDDFTYYSGFEDEIYKILDRYR